MPVEEYIFCIKCGAKNHRGSTWCEKCGVRLTTASYSTTITGRDADDVARVAGEMLDRNRSHAKRRIRVLFLSANPDDTTQLRIVEECNTIDSRIQASEFRDQFALEQRHAVSLLELQLHLLRFKPNIVHFSGHGSEKGTLVFEKSDGESEEASPGALSALFKVINEGVSENRKDERVRVVVLSACYSQQQARAIAQHVDCVVGISDAVKDKSATSFAASFYQALAFGQSIKTAFDLGRNQLGLQYDPDEHILMLEHRHKMDPSKIFLAGTPSVGELADQEHRKLPHNVEALDYIERMEQIVVRPSEVKKKTKRPRRSKNALRDSLLKRGERLYDQGRIEESIECYDKATEIDPNNSNAWNKKGYALYDLVRHKEAIECYDKATEIDPNNSNAWYNRALALYNLGKNKEAIRSVDQALAIEPDNPDYSVMREKLSKKWWNRLAEKES